ncbi:MAG: HAD family hydrolase [Candidatus Dormibacteria bacterium]
MTSHPLVAVIFDVDGTLVDSERDGHRVAFNRAFEEFGMPDRWEVGEYGRLLAITGGERRLDTHLARRIEDAAQRARLATQLHARKTEIFHEMVVSGMVEPRPGVLRLLDELEAAGVRLGVATTGTRAWVLPLLGRVFGATRFETVITGDEAPDRKPDPSAYHLALRELGAGPSGVVAIEDSRNGLVAARGAGLPCVVVVNDYTRGQDFSPAQLVLDGFGDSAVAATPLSNPSGLALSRVLDLTTLRQLVA